MGEEKSRIAVTLSEQAINALDELVRKTQAQAEHTLATQPYTVKVTRSNVIENLLMQQTQHQGGSTF